MTRVVIAQTFICWEEEDGQATGILSVWSEFSCMLRIGHCALGCLWIHVLFVVVCFVLYSSPLLLCIEHTPVLRFSSRGTSVRAAVCYETLSICACDALKICMVDSEGCEEDAARGTRASLGDPACRQTPTRASTRRAERQPCSQRPLASLDYSPPMYSLLYAPTDTLVFYFNDVRSGLRPAAMLRATKQYTAGLSDPRVCASRLLMIFRLLFMCIDRTNRTIVMPCTKRCSAHAESVYCDQLATSTAHSSLPRRT